MPLARHAAAGESLAPSEAAEGCGIGGSSGGGGVVVKDHAAIPPAIDDPEDDPQQRANDGGEEEETQCSVRAKASAPVTEPQLQCGSSRGGGGDNDEEGDEGDDGNAAPSSFGEVGSI